MKTGEELKVKDVMTRQVITLSPDHSVRHGAQIMIGHQISGIPVVDGSNVLVGILTEGDLIRRTEIGKSFRKVVKTDDDARAYVRGNGWSVADVMTTAVFVASENMSLGEAAALMEEHSIKRLPVIRDQQLVGIVSRADIIKAVADSRPEPIAKGDEAIRTSVLARMSYDMGLDDERPSVGVIDGVVHLWGDVASKARRDAIHVLVENVSGVAGIEDHMVDRLK